MSETATTHDGVAACKVPGCSRTPRSRGLCDTHYTLVALRVKRGEHTWEDLEARGKSLPLQHRRPGSVRMKDWLAS